jgi:hypothetical protein
MRLTIELVPQPCWYSNLRNKMTRAAWDLLRTLVYATYNDRCGICHASKHISGVTLHCYEIWQFDLGIRCEISYKADEDTPCLRYGSDYTPIMNFRHGSKERDRSSSTERSSPIMLSAAKHLSRSATRCFAALSMTLCDCSNCQGLFFTIEPCLNKIRGVLRKPRKADKSALGAIHRPLRKYRLFG